MNNTNLLFLSTWLSTIHMHTILCELGMWHEEYVLYRALVDFQLCQEIIVLHLKIGTAGKMSYY